MAGKAPDHVPAYIRLLLNPASVIGTPRRASGEPFRSVARCGIPLTSTFFLDGLYQSSLFQEDSSYKFQYQDANINQR
jgi:hypothetical protein